jgi:hypothetical protein
MGINVDYVVTGDEIIRGTKGITNPKMATKETMVSKVNGNNVMSLHMCRGSWVKASNLTTLSIDHGDTAD